MSEKLTFDFGKSDNQKKFEDFPDEQKERIPESIEEETNKIEDQFHSDEEQKEAESDMKTIEIPEIGELHYKEKIVRFSEKNIKETGGVKGYVKKMITWEEIGRIVLNEDLSYEDILNAFEEKNPSTRTAREKAIRNLQLGENTNINKILFALTNGEFPNKTFNHVFGGVYRQGSLMDFFKEKALLQNIFGFFAKNVTTPQLYAFNKENETVPVYKIIKELSSEKRKYTGMIRLYYDEKTEEFFSHEADSPMTAEVKNKIANMKYVGATFDKEQISFSLNESCPPQVKRSFLTKDLFYLTPAGAGLSLSCRGGTWGINPHIGSGMVFGFGQKNKVFQSYLEKAETLYQELKAKLDQVYVQDINDSVKNSRYAEKRINERIYNQKEKNKYLGECFSVLKSDEKLFLGLSDEYHDHPRIPIILNHPGIPSLSWCHSDYACIPTKKSWNIIEMITEDEKL